MNLYPIRLSTLLGILLGVASAPVLAQTTVRVIDLNTGSGTHGRGAPLCRWCPDGCDLLPNNTAIVGLRRLLGREAVDGLRAAKRVVISLQELDVDTARNPGWNMPEYFRSRLEGYTGQTWHKAFLASRPFQGGQYGIGLLTNSPFTKQESHKYAWSASNTSDWGCEPQVALAGKIVVNPNNVLWVVNTHLAAKNQACTISDAAAVDAASRQIWQVLGMMGRMDPDHPILLTGDFNIRQGGHHRVDGTSTAHKNAYEAFSTILRAAGFKELGYVGDDMGQPIPCFEAETCTFKPWNDYSRLDYMFLRDPHNKITATDMALLQPVVDGGCYLTDHKGLRVDLTFVD